MQNIRLQEMEDNTKITVTKETTIEVTRDEVVAKIRRLEEDKENIVKRNKSLLQQFSDIEDEIKEWQEIFEQFDTPKPEPIE